MVHTRWRRAGILALALAAASLATMTGGANIGSAQTLTTAPQPIATLRLDGGYRFEFVDGPAGTVGVGEVSPAGARSKLAELVDGQKATPLEVFMAVAPRGTQAPARLTAAHAESMRLAGRPGVAPRQLTLVAATGGTAAPGGATESLALRCRYNETVTPGHSDWARDWFFEHQFKDDRAQDTYEYRSLKPVVPESQRTWYAGSSGARWLAACHGETQLNFGPLHFQAQYKSNSGAWVPAWSTQIDANYQVRYFSQYGPPNWRIELYTSNAEDPLDFGVAVAINKPLGIVLGGGN